MDPGLGGSRDMFGAVSPTRVSNRRTKYLAIQDLSDKWPRTVNHCWRHLLECAPVWPIPKRGDASARYYLIPKPK